MTENLVMTYAEACVGLCQMFKIELFAKISHCVESVQIRSFFWSVFSRIRTEYGYLLCKFSYSVLIRQNTDQKKLRVLTLFTQ